MKFIIEQAKLENAKEIDKMLTSLIQELVNWAKMQGAFEVELSVCKENQKQFGGYLNYFFVKMPKFVEINIIL